MRKYKGFRKQIKGDRRWSAACRALRMSVEDEKLAFYKRLCLCVLYVLKERCYEACVVQHTNSWMETEDLRTRVEKLEGNTANVSVAFFMGDILTCLGALKRVGYAHVGMGNRSAYAVKPEEQSWWLAEHGRWKEKKAAELGGEKPAKVSRGGAWGAVAKRVTVEKARMDREDKERMKNFSEGGS